jgi:hypothetical protein
MLARTKDEDLLLDEEDPEDIFKIEGEIENDNNSDIKKEEDKDSLKAEDKEEIKLSEPTKKVKKEGEIIGRKDIDDSKIITEISIDSGKLSYCYLILVAFFILYDAEKLEDLQKK